MVQVIAGEAFIQLAAIGGPGIACGIDGVTLGPFHLVKRSHARDDCQYSVAPHKEVAEAFALAFGLDEPAELARRFISLERIADCLNNGDQTRAMIFALLMRLPGISAGAVAKMHHAARLLKYSPDQPRVPGGNSDGGQWTSSDRPNSDMEVSGQQMAQAVPIPFEMPILPRAIPLPEEVLVPPIYPLQPQNPYPDDAGCREEWEAAKEFCGDLRDRGKLGPRSGFGADYNKCLLGQVSERCGGNPVA